MVSSSIIVAYFTAWSIYSRSFFISDIPADRITHINYAFANIDSDGRIVLGDPWADVEKTFEGDTWDQPLRGNFHQLNQLKRQYPHIQTLISVGGWTWSGRFSDVARTDQSRKKFAESCVDFVKKYDFDGVDLDWEYPVSGGLPGNSRRPEDKQNYVLLLKELREQLEIASVLEKKNYLLTVATGAAPERIKDMNLAEMSKYVDWINIMTYDFHGSWESKTGHNAPLFPNNDETTTDTAPSFVKSRYNCHGSVQGYIEAGAPRSKLVMGLGLYGRGWKGVDVKKQGGFSQPASSEIPMGTWENGVYDYDHLKKSYIPTYTRYWDDQSKVPFLYNSSTTIWITYDDSESIEIKSDYIKREQLAGAMFWELSGDRNAELVTVAFDVLHNGLKPSLDSKPVTVSKKSNSTSEGLFIKRIFDDLSEWQENKQYKFGDHVIYGNRIYICIIGHTSLPGWTPYTVGALWKSV